MINKSEIYTLLKRAKNINILVVGDIILDKYIFCKVNRISPEAPVPVAHVLYEKSTLGGAANVANNLSKLGCKTFLIGAIGRDYNAEILNSLLKEHDIIVNGTLRCEFPTTTKVRVIGEHQQMLRVDFEEDYILTDKHENELLSNIQSTIKYNQISCIILSDYMKGVCSVNLCKCLIDICKRSNMNILVDPKGDDWGKYRGVNYITPNVKELKDVLEDSIEIREDNIDMVVGQMRNKYNIEKIIVTRSEKGLSAYDYNHGYHIPAIAHEVYDVSGAGDTVISVLAMATSCGIGFKEVAYLANLAAGFVVSKVGTYSISNEQLLHILKNDMNYQ